MELHPVVAEHLDVVQGAWAVGMTRDLNLLSWREGLKNLLATARSKRFELMKLGADINLGVARTLPDLFNLLLKFNQGFLELEQRTAWHGESRE